MEYLRIRRWRDYQHYKNRNPPWVKLHVKVLEDQEFRGLSVHARLLALLLLCVAARRDNHIPNDVGWLTVETGMPRRLLAPALADLLAARYLECSQNAMPRDRDREQRQRVKDET